MERTTITTKRNRKNVKKSKRRKVLKLHNSCKINLFGRCIWLWGFKSGMRVFFPTVHNYRLESIIPLA